MVIANGMMIVVSYGPDIAMALVGRISLKQLFKNAGITTASVAGAAIGNTILPVVGLSLIHIWKAHSAIVPSF